MTSQNNENKDTLDDFFSSTLFLYPKWPGGEPCGCAIPRETWLSASTAATVSCPLCGTPEKVVAVVDGYTHSLQTNNSNIGDKEQGRPTLLFKHGSLTYQVGLPKQNPRSSSPRLFSFPTFGWFFLGGQNDTIYYAQNHLAYILGLELSEMKVRWLWLFEKMNLGKRSTHSFMYIKKILCKGKIIFPSPTTSPHNISDQLIQESASGQKSPRLLVMGTPHAQQLTKHRTKTSTWLYQWLVSLLWWPYLFFESFLPQSLRLKRD